MQFRRFTWTWPSKTDTSIRQKFALSTIGIDLTFSIALADGRVIDAGQAGRWEWEWDYLRHSGPEHVLCFAPTRSSKGIGLVIPTFLTWPGSSIVHGIKGENWTLTAGWRHYFGRVLLFDPTNPDSLPYNPQLEVRRGDAEVRDVQNITDSLVDPEGARTPEPLGKDQPFAFGRYHVLYAKPDKTLAGVANFLSDPRHPIETTLRAMMTTHHLGDRPHLVVASAAREKPLASRSPDARRISGAGALGLF